jgi:hypothetical protein
MLKIEMCNLHMVECYRLLDMDLEHIEPNLEMAIVMGLKIVVEAVSVVV